MAVKSPSLSASDLRAKKLLLMLSDRTYVSLHMIRNLHCPILVRSLYSTIGYLPAEPGKAFHIDQIKQIAL
jgi:hypothetical protein